MDTAARRLTSTKKWQSVSISVFSFFENQILQVKHFLIGIVNRLICWLHKMSLLFQKRFGFLRSFTSKYHINISSRLWSGKLNLNKSTAFQFDEASNERQWTSWSNRVVCHNPPKLPWRELELKDHTLYPPKLAWLVSKWTEWIYNSGDSASKVVHLRTLIRRKKSFISEMKTSKFPLFADRSVCNVIDGSRSRMNIFLKEVLLPNHISTVSSGLIRNLLDSM